MTGSNAIWEPCDLLGAGTRRALEQGIGSKVADWMREWGPRDHREMPICNVLERAPGELGLLRAAILYEAALDGRAALALIAPQGAAALLLPVSVTLGLSAAEEASSVPIAATVDHELARKLMNGLLDLSDSEAAVTCGGRTVSEHLASSAYSRWITIEVRLSHGRTLFIRVSPQLVFDRFAERPPSAASALTISKRSAGMAGMPIRVYATFAPLELTLADVAGLEVGDVILLPRDSDTNIHLYARDSMFAQGSLGRADTGMAVKIASFFSHPLQGKA